MYEIIEAAEGIDESAVPSHSYVPDEMGEHESPGGQGSSGMRPGNTVFDADKQ